VPVGYGRRGRYDRAPLLDEIGLWSLGSGVPGPGSGGGGMPRNPADDGALADATLRLLIASGVGPATVRKLRSRFGSDAAAVSAGVGEMSRLRGVSPSAAVAVRRALDEADPARERVAMIEAGAAVVLRGDADFPALLAATPDAPEALWVRGRLSPDDALAIAIVGARQSTAYGREQACRLAARLSESGLTIVSGGARGIDAAAHRGALRVGGRTVAVLGCGLGVSYPPEHSRLFERICDAGGALLSEHPMRAPPLGKNFPRRNRIISGLSLGVVVIEAAARSGALITARLAAESHGREVMALPGRVDSPASQGCLRLLRDGGAGLVIDHADVLRQLDQSAHPLGSRCDGPDCRPTRRPAISIRELDLTTGQRAIMEALIGESGPLFVDQLSARTGRGMSEMMADLTLLELRGQVRRDHKGVHIRDRR